NSNRWSVIELSAPFLYHKVRILYAAIEFGERIQFSTEGSFYLAYVLCVSITMINVGNLTTEVGQLENPRIYCSFRRERRKRKQIKGANKRENSKKQLNMSALFNFHSFLTVVLLGICTCTYLKMQFPALLEQKTGTPFGNCCCICNLDFYIEYVHLAGFEGFFWKAARIGERLSPWVAVGCFTMGFAFAY
ncbi:unnamed protein product, partial [Thlaspi arvense]